MESLFRYIASPSSCNYLPGQTASLEYEIVGALTPAEYLERLKQGWRRFGHMLFRPRCSVCRACRSLRVPVETFRPNRSQRRTRRANEHDIELRVGQPSVTQEKLCLYDRFHAFQAENKDWPEHPAKDEYSYADSYVNNPFPTLECCYYHGSKLVGVGYADDLPGGMSAIYYFYDPDYRVRALGVWNVLCLIAECRTRKVPHLYLGYYVEGCGSLSYKANYEPNEVLDGASGTWQVFRE